MHFVTRDVADKVMVACPDDTWRLMFALARYGGLRCPSEHVGLEWSDIDFEKGRIRVTSPKTERHAGGGERMVPLFPELRPILERARKADPAAVFVFPKIRSAATNFRTQLQRIIEKAKVEPWPKLFQNLRSSRQTELAETWPIHVVCSWLGNSQKVAAAHYLQVTDAYFDAAAVAPKSAPHSGKDAGTSGNTEDARIPAVPSVFWALRETC